jgi:HPt (histidine-containing phosphotransfer) domain-containing protein
MEQYQNEDMNAAAASLHTLAGVAGNIGIESLFVDARELSRIFKDLPTLTPSLLENTLTDRINTLITSLESMTENIELALGLTENTPINKAEHQSEFEFQNSLNKLYQLLNDADSEAGECCEELLLNAQVSGALKERLLEANKYIETLDFDNAIKALKQD